MMTIGVSLSNRTAGVRLLLDALEELFPVRFEEHSCRVGCAVDAWLVDQAGGDDQGARALRGRPCYTVVGEDQLLPCAEASTVEFSRHDALPRILRGRSVNAGGAAGSKALPLPGGDMAVLASKAGAPLWSVQRAGGHLQQYVALPLPEMAEGESLFQHFSGSRFLPLLPLLLFLRTLVEDDLWEPPPLQACFMFDDPNLRRQRYGFIDFATIAAHAQEHGYHVCFATIPLDARQVHMPTALLFQRQRERLSLLIHGNNHTARELARAGEDHQRRWAMQQALGRVAAFERLSGVAVARVMAPPHGACSERTLSEMAAAGFEAACVSSGSLRHYNTGAAWVRTLGMSPADIIAGLPVMPRFPLATGSRDRLLLAALLHQPVIAMGHHRDVAEGLRPLAELADFVNSFGTVVWSDMQRISRSRYATRRDGDVVRLKMFTKRVEFSVPDDTTLVRVEQSSRGGSAPIPHFWRSAQQGSAWTSGSGEEAIPVLPGQKIEIAASVPTSAGIDAQGIWETPVWPLLRRRLTEARDRLAPALRRARRVFGSPSRGTA
jgi:hypothetical protein